MKPCLSEATTMPSTFADDVACYADVGCEAMEVWLTKLETHLASHSLASTQALVRDRNLTLAAASYQGGLLLSEGEARQAQLDHFRRRLDICQGLGIRTLLLVPDFVDRVQAAHLERAGAALANAAQWADSYGVTLALEFRHRNSVCTSLDTALALVESCGEPNVGINLDVFHYYLGPSKFEDLRLLAPERLAFVQLSDLAGVPRELADDGDRILPGDGDFQLAPILQVLRDLGYQGYVSLELMNPTLWQAKPAQVAEIGLTALRKMLGMAITPERSGLHAV